MLALIAIVVKGQKITKKNVMPMIGSKINKNEKNYLNIMKNIYFLKKSFHHKLNKIRNSANSCE